MTFETFESLTFQCLTPQDITVELAALNQKVYNSSLYLYSIDCFGKYILPDFEKEKPNPYRSVQCYDLDTTGKEWKWTLKIAVYLEASKNRYSPSKSGIITPAIAGIASLDVLRGADWLTAYSFKTCYTCLEWSACEISKA